MVVVHGHNQPDKPETVSQTEAPEDCSLEVLMHEEQDGAFDRWEGRTESARRASEAEENALHLALLERDFLDDPQDPRTLYYLGASGPSHEFRSRSKPSPSSPH